jgi:dienelactone hydrolase
MKYFLTVFSFIIWSLTMNTRADVMEQKLDLPNKLGSAVLYTSDIGKPKAGVIVIHEWWGLNDYARGRARQLAELGYAAIAVDMYGNGKVAEHPKDAQAFMMAAMMEPDKMNARFQAAKTLLEKNGGVASDNVYAIGYCFGGAVVLNQARMGTNLVGVASFHGMLDTKTRAKPGTVKAKILVATGGADPMVSAEQVGAFTTEMQRAGVDLELISFPGVKHGFTNPAATENGKKFDMPLAYDEHADKVSWEALLKFLQ